MKKYIITFLLCLTNIIVVFAQDSNKIISKTTRSTQSLGRIKYSLLSSIRNFRIMIMRKICSFVMKKIIF